MVSKYPQVPPLLGVIYTETGFRIVVGAPSPYQLKEIQLKSKQFIRSSLEKKAAAAELKDRYLSEVEQLRHPIRTILKRIFN